MGEWDWEVDLRTAYRHLMRRCPTHLTPRLRVSYELAMQIQDSPRAHFQIEISKNDTTWQGIPMRIDHTLPPGCFIFDEGEKND